MEGSSNPRVRRIYETFRCGPKRAGRCRQPSSVPSGLYCKRRPGLWTELLTGFRIAEFGSWSGPKDGSRKLGSDVWLLEGTRFTEHSDQLRVWDKRLTPFVHKQLEEAKVGLKKRDIVENIRAEARIREFTVWRSATISKKLTIEAIFVTDQDGTETFSHYDVTCSCGYPAIARFPCWDALTVADQKNFDAELLVPPELWTKNWRIQYPEDMVFQFPTIDILRNHPEADDMRDQSLFLPIIAPTKRGRPRVGRHKSSMEKTMNRNLARNARGGVGGGR